MQVGYYDQQREQLDPERTVFDTVGDGNDTVTVNGDTRDVHGYLRDFLFSRDRANSPVKALSGGERNRLLLARLQAELEQSYARTGGAPRELPRLTVAADAADSADK